MIGWAERVRTHAVWGALTALDTATVAGLLREAITAEAADSLERLNAVAGYALRRLKATDPILIQQQALDNLTGFATQARAHVETFTGNGDFNQLTAANAQADNIIAQLPAVLATISSDDVIAIGESTAKYRETLIKHLAEALQVQQAIAQKNAINEQKIATLEAAIAAEKERLSALTTEQQSLFSASQDKRASEFSTSQTEYLTKYSAASADQQSQFSSDQDARRTAFSDFMRDSQQTTSELMTKYDDKLKEHDAEFQKQEKLMNELHQSNLESLNAEYKAVATEILEDVRKRKAEVESLVGVIGNLGVTSGYKKVADHARWALYFWQFVTLVALAGLITVATFSAFPALFPAPSGKAINGSVEVAVNQTEIKTGSGSQTPTNGTQQKSTEAPKAEVKATTQAAPNSPSDSDFYHGLATRIFLSITFGIFAAYAGKQASHAAAIEQRNRKMALELEALGPFIEPLDKPERDKFRVQIGDRSFGVPDHEAAKPKEDDPTSALGWLKSKDGVQSILGPFKDLVKEIKS